MNDSEGHSRCSFIELLVPLLDTDRALVVMGEFNCVCNTKDLSATQNGYDGSATALHVMVHEHNLVDVACRLSEPLR